MNVAVRDGSVSIPETAKYFNVTVETIRRDVNALCSAKKLRKVHGGAVPLKHALRRDPNYASRVSSKSPARKKNRR